MPNDWAMRLQKHWKMGREAQRRGMTPEILESILNDQLEIHHPFAKRYVERRTP
jgi:hypothetical protein